MKPCDSLWQTQALLDGRLSGKTQRAAERHVETCERCRVYSVQAVRIRHSLEELGGAAPSEFELRRGRNRLLAAAVQASRPPGPRSARKRLILVAAVFLALGILWVRLGSHAMFPHGSSEYSVAVHPAPGARYTRSTFPDQELVKLEDGELELRIVHGRGERSLLVRTPDLEIEDQGTVFRVRVEARKTTRVQVLEGRVALRGAGPRPILIEAGDTWSPPPQTSVAKSEAPELAPTPQPSAAPSAAAGDTTQAPRAPRPPAPSVAKAGAPTPKPSAATPNSVPSADSDFEIAMRAFRAGQWGEAARLFAVFQQAHPGARSEDAAYLRVVSLQRAGRSAEMRAAAKAYLASYPNGFRAKEIRGLIGQE